MTGVWNGESLGADGTLTATGKATGTLTDGITIAGTLPDVTEAVAVTGLAGLSELATTPAVATMVGFWTGAGP